MWFLIGVDTTRYCTRCNVRTARRLQRLKSVAPFQVVGNANELSREGMLSRTIHTKRSSALVIQSEDYT